MDVNAIKDAVLKLSQDEKSKAAFAANPVQAVESLLGVDLPDELVNTIINATKEKLAGKDINDVINAVKDNKGLLDTISGFLGKPKK